MLFLYITCVMRIHVSPTPLRIPCKLVSLLVIVLLGCLPNEFYLIAVIDDKSQWYFEKPKSKWHEPHTHTQLNERERGKKFLKTTKCKNEKHLCKMSESV